MDGPACSSMPLPMPFLYDLLVHSIHSLFLWRCPTSTVLLPLFRRHIGEHAHMDVAIGTGYYLANSVQQLAKTKNVTLLDLSSAALTAAEARVRAAGYRGTIDKVHQSVLDPLPESLRGKFDSVSMFHILDHLPGTFPPKASHAFTVLSAGLAADGVLYGATVCGKGVEHTWLSRVYLWLCDYMGWSCNTDDNPETLEKALRGCFDDVEMKVVGIVALFEARKPIHK